MAVAAVRGARQGTYQLNSNGVQLIQGLAPPSELLQKHAHYSQQALRVTPYTRDQARNYAYAYGVNSPSTGDQKAAREERQGNIVVGQYQVVEPDGAMRVVDYSVTPGAGFQASVNRHEGQQYSHGSSTTSLAQKTRSHHLGNQKSRSQQFQQSPIHSQQQFQQDPFQNQQQFHTQQQIHQDQFQNQQFRQAQFRSQSSQDQFQNLNTFPNQQFSQDQLQGHESFPSQQNNNQDTSQQEFQDQRFKNSQFQKQDNYERDFQNQQRTTQVQQRAFFDQQKRQRVHQGRQFEENRRATLFTSVPGSSVVLKTTFGDTGRDGNFKFQQQQQHQTYSRYSDHQLNPLSASFSNRDQFSQRFGHHGHSSAFPNFNQRDQNPWNVDYAPVRVVLA